MDNSVKTLHEASYHAAVELLVSRDQALAAIVEKHGPPPFWIRPEGFATLVHIILEQQVSLASALAAFDKLKALTRKLTPSRFLALSERQMRSAGLSRQKIAYCRIAAEAILTGELDLPGLNEMEDEQARNALMKLKGIGPWTADVYLQMALKRPDIWPVGDLALQVAIQRLWGLEQRPKAADMAPYGEAWRPYRTVAATILWHGYLSQPTFAYR